MALRRVSLHIAEGECLALIGSSGSGKTTLLRCLNRMIEPTDGKVVVGGEDVCEWDVFRLRRSMGYVMQSGGLFPHFTVERNLSLVARLESWSPTRIDERSRVVLELVGLEPDEYLPRFPHELSGGQRQRVGVARALFLDPPIVLMDEPFGALDPVNRERLQVEFLGLQQTLGKTVVMVTHDMKEAFRLGDRVALLSQGELLQVGSEEQFRQSPQSELVRAFLKEHLQS